jgi:hypothetical protein
MFLFQKITERHNCPAHKSSKALKGPNPILKINEIAEYSSYDEISRKFRLSLSPLDDYPDGILLENAS